MVSKAVPSAPPRRMAVSRARANSLLGDPARRRQQGQHLGQGGVGDGRGPGHAGHLAGVLHLAQRLDHPGGRHHLGTPRSSSVQRRLAAQVTLSASRPTRRRPARARARTASRWAAGAADLDVDRPADPGRRHLLGRLGPVAAVGGEQGPVGGDHQHAGRAGEPGQVAHVGQVGDDQGVDLGLVETGRSDSSRAATSRRATARTVRSCSGLHVVGVVGLSGLSTPGATVAPLRGRIARRAAGPPPRRPARSRAPRSRRSTRRPPGPPPRCGGTARGRPGSTGAARPPPRRRRPGRRGATTRCG